VSANVVGMLVVPAAACAWPARFPTIADEGLDTLWLLGRLLYTV